MPIQIYHLSPEGIRQEKRTAIRQGIFIAGFSTLVGIVFPTLAGIVPLAWLWILVPMLLAMFLYGLRRMLQLLQDRWNSFRLTLSPTSIGRIQTGVRAVEITRTQVTQIQEKTGGLFLSTAEQQPAIHIPTGLDGYQEVKATLQQWQPIETMLPQQDYRKSLHYALFGLFTVSLGALFLATNGWTVSLAGAYVVLFLLYGQIKLHQDAQVDQRAKFRLWQRVFLVSIITALVVLRIYVTVSPASFWWLMLPK